MVIFILSTAEILGIHGYHESLRTSHIADTERRTHGQTHDELANDPQNIDLRHCVNYMVGKLMLCKLD